MGYCIGVCLAISQGRVVSADAAASDPWRWRARSAQDVHAGSGMPAAFRRLVGGARRRRVHATPRPSYGLCRFQKRRRADESVHQFVLRGSVLDRPEPQGHCDADEPLRRERVHVSDDLLGQIGDPRENR